MTTLLDALTRNMDSIIYVLLVVMLAAVALHADRRYDQERARNIVLERRIRSLSLVIQFQQAVTDAKLNTTTAVIDDTSEPEVLDFAVDTFIARMGYCLTCHKLKAPSHFKLTDHLQLEDDNLLDGNDRQES